MVVFVNLDEPLISQVLINGATQRIEYEHLPTVCFQCGHYGHTKEICPKSEMGMEGIGKGDVPDKTNQGTDKGDNKRGNTTQGTYRPWMLVKKKSR